MNFYVTFAIHTIDGRMYRVMVHPGTNIPRPTENTALRRAMSGKRDTDTRVADVVRSGNSALRMPVTLYESLVERDQRRHIIQVAEKLDKRGRTLGWVPARKGYCMTRDPKLIAGFMNDGPGFFHFQVTAKMVLEAQRLVASGEVRPAA